MAKWVKKKIPPLWALSIFPFTNSLFLGTLTQMVSQKHLLQRLQVVCGMYDFATQHQALFICWCCRCTFFCSKRPCHSPQGQQALRLCFWRFFSWESVHLSCLGAYLKSCDIISSARNLLLFSWICCNETSEKPFWHQTYVWTPSKQPARIEKLQEAKPKDPYNYVGRNIAPTIFMHVFVFCKALGCTAKNH